MVRLAPRLSLILLCGLFLSACNRNLSEGHGRMAIVMPSENSLQGRAMKSALATLPTSSHKICYAANIVGAGITSTSSSCGPTKGVFSHFVGPGEAVELTVAKGSERTLEIYAYITPNKNEPCPAWNFNCSSGHNCKVFRVAQQTDLNIQGDTEVSVSVNFPGWDKNVVINSSSPLMCSPQVRSLLYSNGDIRSDKDTPLSPDLSHPTNENMYWAGTNIEVLSHSHTASEINGAELPPYIYSLSKHPDNGRLYGLMGTKIVEVNLSEGNVLDLEASNNCIFPTCKVPEWLQSISIGIGGQVFGLDHAGGIWKLEGSGQLIQTNTSVPPYVSQVAFF